MTAADKLPPYLDPYGDLFALLRSESLVEGAAIRKKLIWGFSHAFPSREAIGMIASHGPIVELGAGSGYWAWLLRQVGVEVVALDRNAEAPPRWTEVRKGGVSDLAHNPRHTLFLCWPPLDEPLAAESLRAYRGEILLHVGELKKDARTGSAEFRRILAESWNLEKEITIPRWPGFEDSLTVWRKNPHS